MKIWVSLFSKMDYVERDTPPATTARRLNMFLEKVSMKSTH